MRLPADAVLVILGHEPSAGAAALEAAWRREGLPTLSSEGMLPEGWEHPLDEIGATTLVICGAGGADVFERALAAAAALGFRLFAPVDACPAGVSFSGLDPSAVRQVSLAQTLVAAAQAKGRERWRAARAEVAPKPNGPTS